MIDRSHPLPITRQAHLLDLSRSSVYYEPKGESDCDLALMVVMDKIHLRLPFYGSRRIKDELDERGFLVGRGHGATLMRRMGIEPLFPKKKLSRPAPGHEIYPCLLRNLEIIRTGQVWSMDITYLPMARGVKISMGGRGRWLDNVFIERLWRSVKYEEVYLKAYESISEARRELTAYFDFYNRRRRHQGLKGLTPDEVCWPTVTLGNEQQAA